ncbi:hypothetical protein AUEXF2481DRAFT_76060 [Aureobasidium subglaciale EXF-2481]|uniref:DUF1917-domain-containing protein n=1 Tax=Aureobasidium subglaciale (strain EXF-2481) TaxID=1043005 RepID=A0A074YP18_AURSE|nr:uncharacterized protein AUEXF2481DRAFT_76060 [Aureobasidium subglaciale EXF-2481]KAI5206294.1 DUF1917-domain-containing protein [Aureobasidium subglaciale]KAI5225077.1 DUF1917-domain-containing protein [Aureobasidium subglaciale]KAI5228683.1 DUF1917-domain-containing protein [Aureobasidium subglaciale]KAI5263666.1 DUF1917-domain-containing protein [Aureobasidium subglaciale]KEQ99435.1 hypothetical protein AUEXF2481DRAFT_76060 [Aureobasidium subglaciale EXF-2481]
MTDPEFVPFAGYISDDSDFHGTSKMRNMLEVCSKSVSTEQLVTQWNETKAAYPVATSTLMNAVPEILYNRLEGMLTARQLTETVDEFLKRLPPSTTVTENWIWIACPIIKGKGKVIESRHAPESEESPQQMAERATALLSQFAAEKERVSDANLGFDQSTITRKLGPLRDQLKEEILDLAVASGVINGKWMLFPSPEDVNRMWKLVAEAVVDGRLGDTAKVAPAGPPNPFAGGSQKKQSSHLICVYTKDFSDLDDVLRALEELVELGLAPRNASDGAIYYKADVYTYLNIDSSNPYGLRASLYSSKEIVGLSKQTKGKDQPSAARSTKRKQQTLSFGDVKKRKS